MIQRRNFLKSSVAAGFSLLAAGRLAYGGEPQREAAAGPPGSLLFRLSRHVPARLFDGERCWCHPRAGIVPGAGREGLPLKTPVWPAQRSTLRPT